MYIKTKILIPVITLILVIATAILLSNMVLFSRYVESVTTVQVDSALKLSVFLIEDFKTKAASASLGMAESQMIVNALQGNDRTELLSSARDVQAKTSVDFCTITDPAGTVLIRTHDPDNYGDSIADQTAVRSAMNGKTMTAIEGGSVIRLSVRSSAPVFDASGVIIGLVSVGFRLDTTAFVDTVKQISGCESTVLLGGTRISTTVMDENGNRVVGSQAPSQIAELFLAGEPYSGVAEIQGRSSITSYAPLVGPNGQAVGALYAGQYLDKIEKNVQAFVQSGAVITFIILAAAAAVILLIVGRIVAPIHTMTRAAVAVAAGDTDVDVHVNTSGEMNTLAAAFERMIENTRHQVDIVQHIASGDLGVPVEMRSDKDVMNQALKDLRETMRAQAASIREEHERVRIMLDATPLASRLWNRDYRLIGCNEAAVKLFEYMDKKEYMDHYFDLSPEYQPNGQLTVDLVKQTVAEAFENGISHHEWMYQLSDGTPIPAENTLVRVPYGDDFVVAAYSRDLREQKKMMAEIEHRDNLLNIANRAAAILFNAAGGESLEAVLTESMQLLGRSVNADRVHIMQNEEINGELYFACKYAWVGDPEANKTAVRPGMRFMYNSVPEWEKEFREGTCTNGPVNGLEPGVREFFDQYGTKSVLVIPVFVAEGLWGLVSFTDYKQERFFGDDEVNILRSAGMMMIIAINRNIQDANIREAHKRTRLLTNSTPLGFNLWDRTLHNSETNDTAVNLFGLGSQREYLDRFADLSPEYQPDGTLSKEKMTAAVNRAFEEGYYQFEWLHQKPDGTPIPAEITLVRLAYADDYVVAGYIRDIREQKRMLFEIEQRDYLRQTINETADILLRSDPDDFFDTLYQCMGMMARAIEADRMYLHKVFFENGNMHNTVLYEWSPEFDKFKNNGPAPRFSCNDESSVVNEKMCRGESVARAVRDLPSACRECLGIKDARAVLIIPVFIKNEFWGFVGFDNCHSDELFIHNEEAIMRSGSLLIANALLRNEYMVDIRETSAKLEAALADAEQATNAKSSFLAHMSHEIRTPLNAVIGFSELTLDERTLDPEAKSNLEKINNAGSTILSIVNDILDISKIESGKLEIYPVQYDTPSLINDTVILNIVRIGEKDITFKLYVDENLPGRLYGDDLRVKQVFNNLLSNAFKYTNSGTVEWRISFERDPDDSGAVWLVSSVQDSGIGIKPDDIKKLFSEYNQVDTKTNRKVEGTGLGLAITKRLVQMMDGTITVESEYGSGTTFTVRLRQAMMTDSPIGAEVAGNLMGMRYNLSRRAGKTKRGRVNLSYAHILLVDDVTTNLDVAKGMMKPYKIKIDCATSGPQAIEMMQSGSPRYSAIFMDHMMPGMDGIEATRLIRELDTDYARNIPIIALTANAIVGNNEMFLNSGFQDFVSKPIDIMKLDVVLRTWVRNRELEKELVDTDDDMAEQPPVGGNAVSSRLGTIMIDGMDKEKALEIFNGDEEILVDVLRSYAESTPPLLAHLSEYLAAENLKDYAIAVHGIKGTSYGISAQTAGDAAKVLEFAAKAADLDAVKAGHAGFVQVAETLLAAIDSALAQIDAAASPG